MPQQPAGEPKRDPLYDLLTSRYLSDFIKLPQRGQSQQPLPTTPLSQTNPTLANIRDLMVGFAGLQDPLSPQSSVATGIGALGSLLPIGAIGGIRRVGKSLDTIQDVAGKVRLGPSKAEAQTFLQGQLEKVSGLARADVKNWENTPYPLYAERVVESFQPHLGELHAALEKQYGKMIPVYRAQHANDPSSGVKSFSLSREGAEEFLGQNYRTGISDTLREELVPVDAIRGIGSTYSGEVLVDTSLLKKK